MSNPSTSPEPGSASRNANSARDHLANERTYLAWIRTAVALMGFGVVIVRLRYPSGTTHFVVIAGKDGFDYLTRVPGRGAEKGLYPLREFGSKIEALRFYERIKPGRE